jgi:lipopolysaccharide transport system ATP-binding protein
MDAIVLRDVTKHFKKSAARRYHTTFKSEFIRWIRRQKRPEPPQLFIESLRGVSLSVERGKTVGVVGRNGAGKSTLLKIITGIYSPTSGTVKVDGRISALLDLGAGFHPDFSGRENILINGIILGMSRSEIRRRMQEIIDFSELADFVDEPVRTYSSGMYMRLAFSVATHVNPEILLIDEILAVGDEHFSRKSRAKMNQFKELGKTILLVTHDLSTVEKWCDQAAWIDAGRICSFGDPSEVVSRYREAVAIQEASATQALMQTEPKTGLALDGRRGDLRLELVRVSLKGGQPSQVTSLQPEDSLDIQVEYLTKEDLTEVDFRVSIYRADGLQVYTSSSLAESVPLPRPLPRSGRLDLVIERLGLTAGTYRLDVGVRSKQGQWHDSHRGRYHFTVRSPVQEMGVLRPPHHWVVEGSESTRPREPSSSAPVSRA